MMTELSLNILDVAENSTRAGAGLVRITVDADFSSDRLTISICDDGCGMTKEQVEQVTDPFFTSRTTRKVGLGVPFFKYAAESAGGSFTIASVPGKGTDVTATFVLSHIDRMPLGDISSTIHTLIVYHPDTDFVYTYRYNKKSFTLDTRQFREILGDLPFDSPEISTYIMEYLTENKLERSEERRVGTSMQNGGKSMKSLEELKAIRERMQNQVNLRESGTGATRVVVGMATCGIASGARPVLTTLSNLVQEKGLTGKVIVTQTGCIGLCQYEPIVEVMEPGKEKVTYIKMNPEKAAEVVERHLIGGHPVEKYTLNSADIK